MHGVPRKAPLGSSTDTARRFLSDAPEFFMTLCSCLCPHSKLMDIQYPVRLSTACILSCGVSIAIGREMQFQLFFKEKSILMPRNVSYISNIW